MKTKLMLRVLVAVLAVFGILGVYAQDPEAQAAPFDTSLRTVAVVFSDASLDNGITYGPGFVDTSQVVGGNNTQVQWVYNRDVNTASNPFFGPQLDARSEPLRVRTNLDGIRTYQLGTDPRLDKLLTTSGSSFTVSNTNGLPAGQYRIVEVAGPNSYCTVCDATSDTATVPAPGSDGAALTIRNSGSIGNPNAHVTVPIDPKALGATSDLRLTFVNSRNVSDGTNPAASNLFANLTSTGDAGPYEVTLSNGGTMTVTYLVYTGDAGQHEVMTAPSRGTNQGLLSWTPTNVLALREVTKSTFGTSAPGQGPADAFAIRLPELVPPVAGLQIDSPSSAPVNAQATVPSCTVGICNGNLVATQAKEASPACLFCTGGGNWLLYAIPIALVVGYGVLKLRHNGMSHLTGGGRF